MRQKPKDRRHHHQQHQQQQQQNHRVNLKSQMLLLFARIQKLE
jgi:hypothetical protein